MRFESVNQGQASPPQPPLQRVAGKYMRTRNATTKPGEPEQLADARGQQKRRLQGASTLDTAMASAIAKLDHNNPEQARVEAVRELADITSIKERRQHLWQSDTLRTTLIASAAKDETALIRVYALRALSNLALDEENQLPMWKLCRSLLLTAAASAEDDEYRRQGLWALVHISLDAPEVQRALWDDEDGDGGARVLLLSGAASADAGDDRMLCLWILTNIACAHCNKLPMWLDEHTRDVVLESASEGNPEAVRVQAFRVLAMLAHDANTHCMWHDDGPAHALLLESSSATQKCRTVRVEALRALQLIGLSRKDVDELTLGPAKGKTSRASLRLVAQLPEAADSGEAPAAVAPATPDSGEVPAAVAPVTADSIDVPSAKNSKTADADLDSSGDAADSGGSTGEASSDPEPSGSDPAQNDAENDAQY